MDTVEQNLSQPAALPHAHKRPFNLHFHPSEWLRTHVTRSWWLTAWLALLAYVTIRFTLSQLAAAPTTTTLIFIVWLVTVTAVALSALAHRHTTATRWLQENLYNSLTNTLLTLILALAILATIRAVFNYAYADASFVTDSDVAATLDFSGANWGAIRANMRNFMVFRFPREHDWRLYVSLAIVFLLAIPSLFVYRPSFQPKFFRSLLTFLWFLSPIIIFILLRGVSFKLPDLAFTSQEIWRVNIAVSLIMGLIILTVFALYSYLRSFRNRAIPLLLALAWFFTPLALFFRLLRGTTVNLINPDIDWGGILLTLIISVFAIVVSFPLGLLLALGRRSRIPGIPAWLTYGAAALLTAWGLYSSTRLTLASAENSFQTLLAYWPLLILLSAYLFQRTFQGNVVAAFSTLYIEVVRGVPLITVLVVAIILFPIFLPPGVTILNTWRVLAGFALFSAAYLAENVRGGLQSIPKGQYEAADAIGLNTFQKYRLIILPQALRAVIPALVGQFIGLFKDTSLIAIIGLFDILGIANSIASQPQWLGVRREAYIFTAVVYYIGSALMNAYSQRLEKRLGVGER
jgi:general L-amino acid transport system permease protein